MKISNSFGKFLLFLIVNLLVHLPFMKLPPCGAHVWRQCNTLAMSRNFATEDMNILKPRIDRRNETDGLTGSHFPLYEWTLALLSKLFGYSELLARIFSLLISSFAMLALYLVMRRLKIRPFAASCSALLLLSIPQIYYDSINAMPDILALSLSLFSLYFFLGYFNYGGMKFLVPALLFSIAGGLIKFQFLIIPFASIAFMELNKKQIITTLIVIFVAIIPILCWYLYALNLTKLNNLREFGLWIQPISLEQKFNTVFNNLFSDLPELLLGWPLYISFIVFFLLRVRQWGLNRDTLFLALWLAGFALFYIVAIERMMHHSYYFMSVIPVMIIIFIKSVPRQKSLRPILVSVVVLNFIWAIVRIVPSRWTEDKMNIPSTFINKEMRSRLQASLPEGAKCVVGPDVSGCIYFYFMNTKGYSFERPEELLQLKNEGTYIEMMRKDGVKFLVCNQYERMLPILEKINGLRLKTTVGEFQVWELL